MEDIIAASERLALAIEAAATGQTDRSKSQKLFRVAQKLREEYSSEYLTDLCASSSLNTGTASEEGTDYDGTARTESNRRPIGVARSMGIGMALLCTTPIYLTGAAVEGTGMALKMTGKAVKLAGEGLKKIHVKTVEKI